MIHGRLFLIFIFIEVGQVNATQLCSDEALNIAEFRFPGGQISSNEVEQARCRYLATQESLNGARVSNKT